MLYVRKILTCSHESSWHWIAKKNFATILTIEITHKHSIAIAVFKMINTNYKTRHKNCSETYNQVILTASSSTDTSRKKGNVVTGRCRQFMHLRRLNKCTATLFIIAYNASKSENEERKTTKYLQSACCLRRCWQFWETRCSHAKRVLIGWFLYLSGWFVKGKKCLLRKKNYRPRLFPLHLCDARGKKERKKRRKKKKKTRSISKKRYRFFFFLGSLCFEHGTYILSCT